MKAEHSESDDWSSDEEEDGGDDDDNASQPSAAEAISQTGKSDIFIFIHHLSNPTQYIFIILV